MASQKHGADTSYILVMFQFYSHNATKKWHRILRTGLGL